MKKLSFPSAFDPRKIWRNKKTFAIYCTLVLAIGLGVALRMYHFSDLARFNDDQVRDAAVIDDMVSGKSFPLLGPKAGGTKFNLGPAPYYLEYPFAAIFGGDPATHAYPVLLGSIASLLLFFLIIKKLLGPWPAIVLTALYGTSFYAVKYAKFAWNPNLIPFIILFFLFALSKITPPMQERRLRWTMILAVTAAIGMQLHTLFLVAMPVMIFCVFAYRFFKHIPSSKHLLIIIGIILLFHVPVFISEFKTGGENFSQFVRGFQGKTNSGSSLGQNVLTDISCNLQSTFYIITGKNPEDTCVFFNPEEIDSTGWKIAVACSAIFWILGIILLIRKIRTLPEGENKKIYSLIGLQVMITFLLGIPLAQELSVRLFIIVIYFPFVLIGLFYDFAAEKISKRVAISVLIILGVALSIMNVQKFIKTYVPRAHFQYTEDYGVLGGITLGESRGMAAYIASHQAKENGIIFMNRSEFDASIKYFLEKQGMQVVLSDTEEVPDSSEKFFLVAKTDSEKKIKKHLSNKVVSDSESFGKFSVFIIEKVLKSD
jgi:hypothetical protein